MSLKKKEIKDFYDRSYKKLFSHKGFVQYLLESFVNLKWVNSVDFKNISLEPVTFIDRLFKKKEADLIWKLPLKNGKTVYLYLLLEFQSTIDRAMPLRFVSYIINFYAQKYKESKEKLPVIFPLVLYNGKTKWTAKRKIQDIIDILEPSLKEYIIHFKYYLVDIGSFSKRNLVQLKRNLVGAMFLMEKARKEKELEKIFIEIVDIIKQETDKKMQEAFIDWLEELFRREDVEEIDLQENIFKTKERPMIVETLNEILTKREKRGKKRGRLEGKLEGKLETAKQMFKEGLDYDLIKRITGLSNKDLKALQVQNSN